MISENFMWDSIFRNTPDGIAILKDADTLLYHNKAFATIFECKDGRLSGSLSNYFSDEKRNKWRFFVKSFRSSEYVEHSCYVYERKNKDGNQFWWEFECSKQDDCDCLLLVCRNITRHKLIEQRLKKARDEAEAATRSKSQFLANTSHELRTPIHTITGMTDLLLDTQLDEEQKEYGEQVRYSADVLLALINDVLDISKMEAGELTLENTRVYPEELFEKSVDLVSLEAHKKGLDIGVYISPEVPHCVMGDPVRIRQIIMNLVNNAVKFTETGEVLVFVGAEKLGERRVELKVSVRDSGVGISEAQSLRLFNAFQQADSSTTRKYGGTGLGLYISRNLSRLMGGDLNFSSDPGSGSDFYFSILLDLPVQDDEKTDGIPSDFFSGKKVLIVDDNKPYAEILQRYLEFWGCRVFYAHDGESALNRLESELKETNKISVCLIDQTLSGIDGWQVGSRIKNSAELADTHLILLNMKGPVGIEESRMRLLGWFDAYLKKPVPRKELAEVIFSVLNPVKTEPVFEEIEVLDELEEIDFPLKKYSILIAEDHHVNQRLFTVILEKMGYQVRTADNGRIVLSMIEENLPDLVFMDCHMPEMNGYEAARIIREKGYTFPVIAVTASASSDEYKKISDAGMDGLVTKPFKKEDIAPVLERYLIQEIEDDQDLEELEEPVELEETIEDREEKIPDRLEYFDYKDVLDTFVGEKELVFSLLVEFNKKASGQLQELCQAESVYEWEKMREIAHSIKGSSRNLSLFRIGWAAEKYEESVKEEIAGKTGFYLNLLSEELGKLPGLIDRLPDLQD